MGFPSTGQSLAVNHQSRHLSNDFMFGFDVEDECDREYLTQVAIHGTGHEYDIKGFIQLGLRRGVEEWEQALSCATAMRELRYSKDSLDGQDILAFLSKIYGVSEPNHTTNAVSPQQSPRRPGTKRKSRKACVSPDAEIPAKKQRRACKSNDSPYWAETPVPVPARQEGSLTRNQPEAKALAKRISARCKQSLGGIILPPVTILIQGSTDNTATRVREGHDSKSTTLDAQHRLLTPASSTNSQRAVSQDREDSPERTLRGSSPAPSESDASTVQDSVASESSIEFAKIGGRADSEETNQSLDDEDIPPPSQTRTPKRKAKSPYFATTKAAAPSPAKSPQKRAPAGVVSSLPFPRLDSERFGLIQEELASDPFWLLIAVTFLIRTTGKAAIPVFRALKQRYPTPNALAAADTEAIVSMIQHLGLGAVRAATIQRYARIWLEDPPRAGVRHAVKKYHSADDNDTRAEGSLEEEGLSASGGGGWAHLFAWEIGHMTQGPYALDSWRIFCRDVLRGMATDWRGGGREGEFQPEWMRVMPRDKELRACLRWMWMREGWLWDPDTGEKAVLPEELRRAVQDGRVGYDDNGNLRILE
ncbi:DNA glycosylase [Nemania abortiva]|nr:DNA glycosylase [Nemania abortiva]